MLIGKCSEAWTPWKYLTVGLQAMPQPLLVENSLVYSSFSLPQDTEEGCNCCDFL